MTATNETLVDESFLLYKILRRIPYGRWISTIDIANELGFKKSSISIAMKNLREKGHITVTDAGFIYLTDSGRAIAEMIYERHEFLSNWLSSLGVDPAIAAEDACRMEHVISEESFNAIKKHIVSHS